MNLEFVEAGSKDGPLIRIYDVSPSAVAALLSQLTRLSSGSIDAVDLHNLTETTALGGLTLKAVVGSDRGLFRRGSGFDFVMTLSRAGWARVAEMAQPFARPASPPGYQWLDETSDISLLISSYPEGAW